MSVLSYIAPRKYKMRNPNRMEVVGNKVYIHIPKYAPAIVDLEDYDLVKDFKWSIKKGYCRKMKRLRKSEYRRRKRSGTLPIPERRSFIATNVQLIDGSRTVLYLHRLVLGLNFGSKCFVKFRDGHTLNCSAENLEIVDFEEGMKMHRNYMSSEKARRLFMILYERNRDRRKQGLLKRIEMYEQPCDENGNLLSEKAERSYLDYFGVKYVESYLRGLDKIVVARERMYKRLQERPRESYKDRLKRLWEEQAKKQG